MNGKAKTQNSRALLLGVLGIFAVSFAVYFPVTHAGFVWDDLLLIDKNPLVTGKLNLATIWFSEDFPLSVIALRLQWLAWGKSALGYHVINVVLHAINCILLWRLLARLNVRGAFLAAMFFAVHPVCVMSVAWVSELKNTLSLAFLLLSAQAYLKSSNVNSDFGFRISDLNKWYWLSLFAFLLALLSKTSVVMLPVLLLLVLWWKNGKLQRRDFLRTAPFFALSLLFGAMSIWLQQRGAIGTATVQTENFFGRLAGAGMAVWFYLGKILFPANLNFIYPRWEIVATSPLAYVPLLCWIACLFACWKFRGMWGRHALLALTGFTISLLPVLGFLNMYFLALSRVSDHLQYFPMIFIVAAMAAAITKLIHQPAARIVAGAAIVAMLCAATFQRASLFTSDEKLWRDVLAKNPWSWTAHNNLGCILAERQDIAGAMKQFETSLELNPQNVSAHVNLGRALAMQGDFARATTQFTTALEIKPRDADARRAFGSMLAQQGNAAEAIAHFREALKAQPDADTRLQLATLLHTDGNDRAAVAEMRQTLATNPNHAPTLQQLAWTLATSADDSVRNGAESVELALRACRLTEFTNAMAVGTLAAAYAETGQFSNAVTTARRAIDLSSAAGNSNFAGINRQLLELYRSGRPYHEQLNR